MNYSLKLLTQNPTSRYFKLHPIPGCNELFIEIAYPQSNPPRPDIQKKIRYHNFIDNNRVGRVLSTPAADACRIRPTDVVGADHSLQWLWSERKCVYTHTTLYSLKSDHVIWTPGVQLAGMLRLADMVEAAHSLYWLWS